MNRKDSIKAIIACFAVLAFCGCLQRQPAPATNPPARTIELSVWVTYNTAAAHCSDASSAHDFFGELKESGVDEVYLQVKSARGEVAFPTTHAWGNPAIWTNASVAAETANISLVAAFPLYLGTAEPGEELVRYGWNEQRQLAELRMRSEMPYRLNPWVNREHDRQVALLHDLGRSGAEAICLSHAGFPGTDFDFSQHARAGTETLIGESLRNWPESVITFSRDNATGDVVAVHGPHWKDWNNARLGIIRKRLGECETAIAAGAAAAGRQRSAIWLMAGGYYQLQWNEAVDWADAAKSPTGIGNIFDGLALEFFAPISDLESATARGFAEWGTLEVSLDRAAAMAPTHSERRAAVAVRPYAGADEKMSDQERAEFRGALKLIKDKGWPVLIVDYDDFQTLARSD